jgi:membrane protease YdiL (CAAX protease family)
MRTNKIILGISIPTIAIVLFLLRAYLPTNFQFNFGTDTYTNTFFNLQVTGLVISLLVLFITLKLAPASKKLLRFGDLNQLSKPVKILGIKATDSWYKTGASYLLVISVVTGIFMYLNFKQAPWNQALSVLPFALFFAVINSFNEEIIARFAVIGLLEGHLSAVQIQWAAAFIFGGIHYFGTPGGLIGVLMAGFLGWILAKSIIETRGIGIAWGVHFVQDVLIYGTLLLGNLG